MRLDGRGTLMEDRADRLIAPKGSERFFDLHKLQIIIPQLHRIGLGKIGAQQIPTLASRTLFSFSRLSRQRNVAPVSATFMWMSRHAAGAMAAFQTPLMEPSCQPLATARKQFFSINL